MLKDKEKESESLLSEISQLKTQATKDMSNVTINVCARCAIVANYNIRKLK